MASSELITIEQVEDVLLHGGDMEVVSAEQIQDEMVKRVLQADTLEEAFGGFKATPCSEVEGLALSVNAIAWMRSAFEEGPKVYALLKCVTEADGEELTVSMGGRTLMASFVRAMREDAMPIKGTFVKERSRQNPEHAFWTFKLAPRSV